MPDNSEIEAVLNYEKHAFLYFVASTKKIGYHKFAKTLSQHNVNAVSFRNCMFSGVCTRSKVYLSWKTR